MWKQPQKMLQIQKKPKNNPLELGKGKKINILIPFKKSGFMYKLSIKSPNIRNKLEVINKPYNLSVLHK